MALHGFNNHGKSMKDKQENVFLKAAGSLPAVPSEMASFLSVMPVTRTVESDELSQLVLQAESAEASIAFDVGTHFQNIMLPKGSSWFYAAQLSGCAVSNSSLSKSFCLEATFNDARFFLVDMERVNGKSISAIKAHFHYVNYSFSQLEKADFSGARFEFVSFVAAKLDDGRFDDATFGKGVLMLGARLDPRLAATLSAHGVICTPDDLRNQISTYSEAELGFLGTVLEKAESEIRDARSSRHLIGSDYLSETHLDHVVTARRIIVTTLATSTISRP